MHKQGNLKYLKLPTNKTYNKNGNDIYIYQALKVEIF
jgi:hypothetical protein